MIAQQLTLIDSEIFYSINSMEFTDLCWQKENKIKDSPGIVLFYSRFNQISQWVSTEILHSENKALYITKFISVMKVFLFFHIFFF